MTFAKEKIVFMSTYPNRECGIATFCQDMVQALDTLFSENYNWQVCALEENETDEYDYPDEVKYRLNTADKQQYMDFAVQLNKDRYVKGVCIQHEFGLFGGEYGNDIFEFLNAVDIPVTIIFHSVLPAPNAELRKVVVALADSVERIIVMTDNSAGILNQDYGIMQEKIRIIPHGTHHVSWSSPEALKKRYELGNKKIISTFGLISENKSIETALYALPDIIKVFPDILYLVIGKTHPKIIERDGEKYRIFLEGLVKDLKLEKNVRFINRYLITPELLEYLQLSDLYLFTSKDPKQAVSGTFAYALSCGCPVITTPFPHARELLSNQVGYFFDFDNHKQLAEAAIRLLQNPDDLKSKSFEAYRISQESVWQNVAIKLMKVFHELDKSAATWTINYNLPELRMSHFTNLVDDIGIVQFSKINVPDLSSGYTLDDNARALIAITMHYLKTGNSNDLSLIRKFLDFIQLCQLDDGRFFNYLDSQGKYHYRNHYVNLNDSNGRAIWALGFLISKSDSLPPSISMDAKLSFTKSLLWLEEIDSPRSAAFIIKGLYYLYKHEPSKDLSEIIIKLTDKLVGMYNSSNQFRWRWFENYLTYANAVMPEAVLMAYEITGYSKYLDVALNSFNFLLSQTFKEDQIRVVSNRGWQLKGESKKSFGEQPIDITYTILALDSFHRILQLNNYEEYKKIAFSWFLGNNKINRVMFDLNTGGCYDGLEETGANLNQGAESTVCFLISQMSMNIIDVEKEEPVEHEV